MKTYSRSDLITDFANRQGVSQAQAQVMLANVFGLITEQIVSGNGVNIRQFGSFNLRVTKPRVGRNPKNPGVSVPIPARYSIKFQPGTEMKQSLASLRPDQNGQ